MSNRWYDTYIAFYSLCGIDGDGGGGDVAAFSTVAAVLIEIFKFQISGETILKTNDESKFKNPFCLMCSNVGLWSDCMRRIIIVVIII